MKINPTPPIPVQGFLWMGRNIGIKDQSLDFGVLAAAHPCSAAAVFTRSNLPGAPVIVGREHAAKGTLQAIVVNSKCANVGLGEQGLQDARKMCQWTAEALKIQSELVLPASTGVIGLPLPMDKIREGTLSIATNLDNSAEAVESFARAIMTTDTHPKWRNARSGHASLLGVAKGSGMIEPNMATMLSYLVTDAEIDHSKLQEMLKRAVDSSFNRISIDTDTSTSDMVVLMANGMAGRVNEEEFEKNLTGLCQDLAKDLVRDGEGVTKLIELKISGADSPQMAQKIGKSIINSPLIKTAVHGADPNWGRFVMAVGKVFEHPVRLEELEIRFGLGEKMQAVNSQLLKEEAVKLESISELLQKDTIPIEVVVGHGDHSETFWGCDLSKGYIDENAFYTT